MCVLYFHSQIKPGSVFGQIHNSSSFIIVAAVWIWCIRASFIRLNGSTTRRSIGCATKTAICDWSARPDVSPPAKMQSNWARNGTITKRCCRRTNNMTHLLLLKLFRDFSKKKKIMTQNQIVAHMKRQSDMRQN